MSLEELASSQGVDLLGMVRQWASSEGRAMGDIHPGFILAQRSQVEGPEWAADCHVGLFVRATGMNSHKFHYPKWAPNVEFPICFEGGRNRLLEQACPRILKTLSQGWMVAIHCENPYHRGPLALCAVLRRLFGLNIDPVMQMIGTRREIWHGTCRGRHTVIPSTPPGSGPTLCSPCWWLRAKRGRRLRAVGLQQGSDVWCSLATYRPSISRPTCSVP